MTSLLERLLHKVTPWYDEEEVTEKDRTAVEVLKHSSEVTARADYVISLYRAVEPVYNGKSFKWIERK